MHDRHSLAKLKELNVLRLPDPPPLGESHLLSSHPQMIPKFPE
jgi:hypothetical protein